MSINNPTCRHSVATINNDTEEDTLQLVELGNQEWVKFLSFTPEQVATRHLQGVIHFSGPTRLSKVRAIVPRIWIRKANGTKQQAYDYTRKTNVPVHLEMGTFDPGISQGSRSDLVEIKELIDSGHTETEIADAFFGQWCRMHRSFARYRQLKAKNRAIVRDVQWFYGPTGTGKTMSCPQGDNVFWKSSQNYFFNGYDGEATVVFDDLRKNTFTFSYLLRLLDNYPMSVEFKGGSCPWLACKIVITTPMHPKEMYDNREDLGQHLLHITKITKFNNIVMTFPHGIMGG